MPLFASRQQPKLSKLIRSVRRAAYIALPVAVVVIAVIATMRLLGLT